MSVIFNVPPILVGDISAVQRILGIQYFGAKFYVGRIAPACTHLVHLYLVGYFSGLATAHQANLSL